jgi:hypothetical protein
MSRTTSPARRIDGFERIGAAATSGQAQHGGDRGRRLFLVPSQISPWKAAYPPSSGKSSQIGRQSLDPNLGITSQHIPRCEATYPPPPPLLTTEVTKQSRCFKPPDTRGLHLGVQTPRTIEFVGCYRWVVRRAALARVLRGRADGAPGPHPPPAPSAHTGYTLAGAAARGYPACRTRRSSFVEPSREQQHGVVSGDGVGQILDGGGERAPCSGNIGALYQHAAEDQ